MRDDLARAQWRKSSRSSNQGQCIEVAELPGGTAVRDSKDQDGPALTFTTTEWTAFTAGVRSGNFD
ncbi:MAG: DUF397 domain-containing protein [Pseudonocardiaceae bacterium]